jgi:hypothetical protein
VVRHIADPATARTFYGALLTSAKKLQYGHFNVTQANTLLPILVELLRGGDEEVGLATRLTQMLPVAIRPRLPQRLRALVADVHDEGVSDATKTMCDTVRAEVDLQPQADPLLPVLVHEMLHDPVFDVRLCAMFLVYATPYRAPVARALAADLVACQRRRGDQQRMLRLLESLRVLGGPDERKLVEHLLLNHDTSASTRDMAAYALGHIGGTSTDGFYRAVLDDYTNRWTTSHNTHDVSILDRLVYAVGITGRDHILRDVVIDPRIPAPVRAASTWWFTLPDHVRQSAQD